MVDPLRSIATVKNPPPSLKPRRSEPVLSEYPNVQLRPSTEKMEHADERNVSILFRTILRIFEKGEPIPADLRKRMLEHRVSMKLYDKLTQESGGEQQYYKHIWLRDGEIMFDEATGFPHGKVIGLMGRILSSQDPNGELELSTGVGMFLITRFLTVDTLLNNLTKKQPDLDLVPINLPMPYHVNNIPLNSAVKKPAPYPHFVFEIAIANETMPKLINDAPTSLPTRAPR